MELQDSGATGAVQRRKPVRKVILACLAVLLLAQALIGALSLSALDRLAADNTAERIELLARQAAAQVQTGLNLGKPLAQFFGLQRLLDGLQAEVPDFLGAQVVLADGRVLAAAGAAMPPAALLEALRAADAGDKVDADAEAIALDGRAAGAARMADGQAVSVAIPLAQAGDAMAGAVILHVQSQNIGRRALLIENIKVLGLSTLAAALALVLALRYVVPVHSLAASRAGRLVPLAILLLAQGVYAGYTIHSFRSVWVDVTRENSRMLAQALQKDLDRVLGYGIAPDRMRGVERPMARLAAAFPVIKELRLLDSRGAVLNRADARGTIQGATEDMDAAPEETLTLPLRVGPDGPAAAQLQLVLDQRLIASGVRARIMDAATVAVVALVAAGELLLLLGLVINRAFATRTQASGGASAGPDDSAQAGLLARPVMFAFLFAVALPLSFLPIYARSLLGQDGGGQAVALLVALPIAAEMACGLVTALLAGRLTDRRGWQFPVFIGLLISVAGNAACALAATLPALTAARGLVGLGYGLTWMGLQGFIVIHSPAAYRGRNMAAVVAGLFAGHLSGAAVGAMLVQQAGAEVVFGIGAGLLCLPAIAVLKLMWPYRHRVGHGGPEAAAPGRAVAAATAPKAAQGAATPGVATPGTAGRPLSALRNLLWTRDFGMLLIGSIVPFSIAQVGLLSYALPLYMEAQGSSPASVGRIFMLYGLCVIYAGPLMGRLADGSANKKLWIAAGGVVGSAGLLGMYFASGVWAAAAAVALLALASCLAGGAQIAYMLRLEHVQQYGAGAATSVMRAADKFGQMLGPLMVGGLFAAVGISQGLALTGAVYLAATVAFLALAPKGGNGQ